jgi:G:T-mismatch repair DNA endonuclease (very short patch repair protein)
MWLLHVEQTDDCRILHDRNGREYRLPELPFYSVDGYCVETRTVYEFVGCFQHSCKFRPFRDIPTLAGDTLAQGYERTMARIERIACAGYNVKIPWECKFDETAHTELLIHPIVRHSPLKTRDALYGGRTGAMRFHCKIGENETIEYCDVISLYPYICKYFKFPIGHLVIHVGVVRCVKTSEPVYERTV